MSFKDNYSSRCAFYDRRARIAKFAAQRAYERDDGARTEEKINKRKKKEEESV